MNWFAAHPDAERFAKDTYQTFPGAQKQGVWTAIHDALVERFGYPGTRNACRVALMDRWRGYKERQYQGVAPSEEEIVFAPTPEQEAKAAAQVKSLDAALRSQGETLSSPLSPKPLTEQEALALFAVDTAKWEVARLSHNTWQQGTTGPDGETLTRDLYQTTIHLKRRQDEGLTELTNRLLASLTAAAPPRGPFVITRTKAPEMLELCRPDLHIGKSAWSPETESGSYDIPIACQDFRDAASDLFSKTAGYKFARIVIPSGNDELHTDNLRSETTSGTRVDSDSRFHKMFQRAVEERIWLIRESLQRAPEVWDVTVPGNHSRLGEFTVGEVVRAYFHNEPRVVFDNRPPLRKYVRWGKTLLGYTHGSEEKHADLPLIMAQERPIDWAETVFRAWRLGHFHKRKQTRFTAGDSFAGVEVRIIRSLSGTDQWHYSKGYVKERRAMEAFVHNHEDGEVGAFISRLPEDQ